MAHVAIVSAAYWGDVMPFVPVAEEHARRGHRVTVAVERGFHNVVDKGAWSGTISAGTSPHASWPTTASSIKTDDVKERGRRPAFRSGALPGGGNGRHRQIANSRSVVPAERTPTWVRP